MAEPENQPSPKEEATKTLTIAEAGEDLLMRIFQHNQRTAHQKNRVLTLKEHRKEIDADYKSARSALDKMSEQGDKLFLEVSDLVRRKQPEQEIIDEKTRIAAERAELVARAAELDAKAEEQRAEAEKIRASLDEPMPPWLPSANAPKGAETEEPTLPLDGSSETPEPESHEDDDDGA